MQETGGEKKQQPMKQRKIPERRCIGCGERFRKVDLIRIVRSPDGEISLDFTGRKPGRGAYLCRNVKCFRIARKARRIEQNLNPEKPIPEEVLSALEEELLRNDAN